MIINAQIKVQSTYLLILNGINWNGDAISSFKNSSSLLPVSVHFEDKGIKHTTNRKVLVSRRIKRFVDTELVKERI